MPLFRQRDKLARSLQYILQVRQHSGQNSKGKAIMDHFQRTLMTPAGKAAVALLTGTALVLACFAPAIAGQKEDRRHDTVQSHRPAASEQGAFRYLA
jgi:hypothetical protein